MSIDKREKTYNNLVGQGNESRVMASPHLEKSKPFDHNKQNIPKKQFVYSNEFITLLPAQKNRCLFNLWDFCVFPLAHTELWARVWQNVQIDVTMSNTKQMSQITLIMDKGHPSLNDITYISRITRAICWQKTNKNVTFRL